MVEILLILLLIATLCFGAADLINRIALSHPRIFILGFIALLVIGLVIDRAPNVQGIL